MIVCHFGKSFPFFEIKLKINKIANNTFTNGAISSPKTAIKLATSAGTFNQEKKRKAVVNK